VVGIHLAACAALLFALQPHAFFSLTLTLFWRDAYNPFFPNDALKCAVTVDSDQSRAPL